MKITIDFEDGNIREYNVASVISNLIKNGCPAVAVFTHPDFSEKFTIDVFDKLDKANTNVYP